MAIIIFIISAFILGWLFGLIFAGSFIKKMYNSDIKKDRDWANSFLKR